jgi:ATP-dependent exoDNAse (exonuclease V) alpha subunit
VRLDRDPQHLTILRPDDLHLKHGFAITTHKAQGATVEKAIVLGSEHTNREVSYVQASRARDSTGWVFTDAKVSKLEQATDREPQRDLPMLDRLKGVVHAMSQSQQKESTLDYQNQKPAPQAHKAAERDGMEM